MLRNWKKFAKDEPRQMPWKPMAMTTSTAMSKDGNNRVITTTVAGSGWNVSPWIRESYDALSKQGTDKWFYEHARAFGRLQPNEIARKTKNTQFELNRFVTLDKNLLNPIKCKCCSIIFCLFSVLAPRLLLMFSFHVVSTLGCFSSLVCSIFRYIHLRSDLVHFLFPSFVRLASKNVEIFGSSMLPLFFFISVLCKLASRPQSHCYHQLLPFSHYASIFAARHRRTISTNEKWKKKRITEIVLNCSSLTFRAAFSCFGRNAANEPCRNNQKTRRTKKKEETKMIIFSVFIPFYSFNRNRDMELAKEDKEKKVIDDFLKCATIRKSEKKWGDNRTSQSLCHKLIKFAHRKIN